MKRKALLALALACTMALSGGVTVLADVKGANEDAANTQETDETLKIILSAEPSVIWAAGAGKTENEAQIIGSALMDGLVTMDYSTNEVEPCLATEWEWVDDTHCKFSLREDAVMSDGTPLVADDVVYTVNEIWIGLNASNDTGRFVAGAVADDEHTVTIEFTTVAPDLLKMMTWSNFGIVSQDEVEAAGGAEAASKNPVLGCGKYKFSEWVSGQSITITRNDDYWNEDYAGYYKDITFTFTNDAAARAMAVQSGDADIAYDMPIVQAGTYASDESVQTIIYDYGANGHVWYNMTDEHATSDIRVRQAIDLALDFDAIALVGTSGYGEAALGYFTTDTPCYNEMYTTEERAVDVEKAKALLEEAGYGDGLELTTVGMQDTVPMYTVMQECLRAVGITLTINTVDTAQFVEDAFGGNYDIISVNDESGARYPAMLSFINKATIESGYVIGGPKTTTDELDAKLAELIEAPDDETAKTVAAELEQMMKDDVIVSNLYPEMHASILNKDLKGFTTLERGFINPVNFYK